MTNTKKSTLKEQFAKLYAVEIVHVEEIGGNGYFIASMPKFGSNACSATGDTREEALTALSDTVARQAAARLDNGETLYLGQAGEREGRWKREPPRAPWPTRMLIEEIATRIRDAMADKDLSLFELAAKLDWAPGKLLQWLDGTLANLDLEDENGSLRELVQIGQALGKRWEWTIGKGGKVK